MPHRASFYCHPWRLSSHPGGHWNSATSEPDPAVHPKAARMVAMKQLFDYVRINSNGSWVIDMYMCVYMCVCVRVSIHICMYIYI